MPSRLRMKQSRIRCSNCDAKNGYMRNQVHGVNKEWVCRACGAETPMKETSDGFITDTTATAEEQTI
jgi:DNA-directed RNA polymerase subunit RPC12/RpoP